VTYLFNDPADFTDELTDGFVAANRALVRRVTGGVVRSTVIPEGQVAVVIGGGSGHYPAFAGLVGPGLAHGAAMGNVFASPSAHQIYSVAKAANRGGGVLFSYGNYAGDVLNFDQAEARLIDEGIPCRTVVVTDDIFSASVDELGKRRGIAGDLVVFRAAAAAAESGKTLDEVWELASRANDRTRSIGVAFTGCTLPGASEPLFTVAEGRMAVGMGIHGEPGIDEVDLPSANGLAEFLVGRLLEDWPASVEPGGGARVAVILNGLGSVKYEELFVVYARVAALLEERGLVVVEPDVGELVTSFSMAGVSLTLTWLDSELEEAWTSAAGAPAYRKGTVGVQAQAAAVEQRDVAEAIPSASDESRAAAPTAVEAIRAIAHVIDANVDYLGQLDAIAGDGDHGIGMQRGVVAARAAAEEALGLGAGFGSVLTRASDAWADRAGGTSGVFWGLILRAVATTAGDETAPTASTLAQGISTARDEVVRFGKAKLGDKTMLDVLSPFADALESFVGEHAGASFREAWSSAATVAADAADATSTLVPKIGRARPHAEKSVGSPDPGAVSMSLAISAVAEVLNGHEGALS
jgi:dihydroxyacetone kinase